MCHFFIFLRLSSLHFTYFCFLIKIIQNYVVWKKKKIDVLFDWLTYNGQVPSYKNVSLSDRTCNLQTIKRRYMVLNIFCFITQKNISKRVRGKNTLNFLSPCCHQGQRCSWIRCVATGNKWHCNFQPSDRCGEHHAMLKFWYHRPCVVDSASNSVFTEVTGYWHYGAFGCQHFTTSLIFNLHVHKI